MEQNIEFHSYNLHGFSPGFVLLLSYSSWLCLASTTRLIQIRSGTEHRIPFLLLSSLHGSSPGFVWLLSHSSWFCFASTTRLIQIRSGTSDSILTFEQFAWIISWVCMASFPQLLVLCGFHYLIQIRSGAEHRIPFLLLSTLQDYLLVLYGFFPTAPDFGLPQLV